MKCPKAELRHRRNARTGSPCYRQILMKAEYVAKDKKQKLRVDFRKNRVNRSRRNDFTRQVDITADADETAVRIEELPQTERLSGKGNLTRRRTIIADVTQDEDGKIVIDVDETRCQRGRVITPIGLNSLVHGADGRQYECTVRRLIRTLSRDGRNAVVAGDWVLFEPTDDSHGHIQRVEPRKSALARGSKGFEHIIVANIDQVVIVASVGEPLLKLSLVDRFVISATKGQADVVICINKADLVDPVELQPVLGRYGQLGYQTVLVSAETGQGIDQLRDLLRDRQSVFSGQSGVGKSSLLNAVQPGLSLQTGEISTWNTKGRHTTRTARLIPLPFGGWVVDTPGIRQMELWDVQPDEVEGYFVEFRPFVTYCGFADCTHTHETNCRVKQAVQAGLITTARYESYLRIRSGQQDE